MNKVMEKCFIITPIGDDSDPIRRHIEGIIDAAILPALGEKYEIIVAHKISEPGSITKQIISEIYDSKLVIANLTNRNPNVMYELALRHAIGKPVIMIAEKGTPLPSDIIMQRVVFYQNDAKGVLELRDNLECFEKEIDFTTNCGPIYDVLGEIGHDTTVLKAAEKNHTNDIQPLEYIVNRLNRIEDAIMTSRSRNYREQIEDKFPKCTIEVFQYENLNRSCNKKILESRLSNVNKVDSNTNVDRVEVDYDKKIITIYIIITNRIDVPAVYRYFEKTLTNYGFEGVTPISPEQFVKET